MIQSNELSVEKQPAPREGAEHTDQVWSAKRGGRFRWLIAPEKPQFLLPIAALLILLLDWLLFSSNVLSAGLATPIVVVVGFLLGSVGTYALQRRFAGDASWKALLKAAIAGVCVGMPWPVGGTLIGGWVLLLSGLGKSKANILRKQ